MESTLAMTITSIELMEHMMRSLADVARRFVSKNGGDGTFTLHYYDGDYMHVAG